MKKSIKIWYYSFALFVISGIVGNFILKNEIILSYNSKIIFTTILVFIYLLGIAVILFKKPKDSTIDNKLLGLLEMKIPIKENYNTIRDNSKNLYIRSANIGYYSQRLFISDLEGNLLYKIQRNSSQTPAIYTMYDPYDNILGTIKKNPIKSDFAINININNNEFAIKRPVEIVDNYEFENIDLEIEGDFLSLYYEIISKEDNSVIAQIDNNSIDGLRRAGNTDVVIHKQEYLLEIVSIAICSIIIER